MVEPVDEMKHVVAVRGVIAPNGVAPIPGEDKVSAEYVVKGGKGNLGAQFTGTQIFSLYEVAALPVGKGAPLDDVRVAQGARNFNAAVVGILAVGSKGHGGFAAALPCNGGTAGCVVALGDGRHDAERVRPRRIGGVFHRAGDGPGKAGIVIGKI